jgi:hypothetical protein
LLFPVGLVDLDDLQSGQDLQDHSGSDDGTDSQFHEAASVAGQDGAHPVEWVRSRVLYDPVQRDLTADQIDQKRNERPNQLVFKCHLFSHNTYSLFRLLYLWKQRYQRSQHIKYS